MSGRFTRDLTPNKFLRLRLSNPGLRSSGSLVDDSDGGAEEVDAGHCRHLPHVFARVVAATQNRVPEGDKLNLVRIRLINIC